MRRFLHGRWKKASMGGLILASPPVCFRVICWPNPRFVWTQPSDCCSITNTHRKRRSRRRKRGDEHLEKHPASRIPSGAVCLLRGRGDTGKGLFSHHGKPLFIVGSNTISIALYCRWWTGDLAWGLSSNWWNWEILICRLISPFWIRTCLLHHLHLHPNALETDIWNLLFHWNISKYIIIAHWLTKHNQPCRIPHSDMTNWIGFDIIY